MWTWAWETSDKKTFDRRCQSVEIVLMPDLPDRFEAVGDDEDLEVRLRSGGHVVAGGLVQELRENTKAM